MCAADIGDLEMLKATYVSHAFSRHTHAGFVVGMIERGVEVFHYRGKIHAALPGDVVVINPDEVHTGYSGSDSGWTYRMFYPSIEILQQVADGISDGPGEMPYFGDAVIKDRQLAHEMRWLHSLLETSQSQLERQTAFYDVMGRLLIRHADNAPVIKATGGHPQIIKNMVDSFHE